ncbi:hypothetical protein PLICRDRAFT_52904 [Plicaturopsis crispa FD-325 SS-3]|nr:hypothetical protein PLICRDRAFT_52904 [Plicaturopsis crispa FD-325 SS-3]
MSRIPQSSARSPRNQPPKTLATPSRSRAPSPLKPPGSPSTPRLRTKSTPNKPSRTTAPPPPLPDSDVPTKPALSIKEAIALKRAEAKKSAMKSGTGGGGLDTMDSLEYALADAVKPSDDDNVAELGRWSVKETIERGRNTGIVSLPTRSLPCIPSALFEIHLGMTPDPLPSVPNEPPLSSASETTDIPGRKHAPAWFEAQDLQVLKMWHNDIVEIQHEISLFGSLKTVDLHENKIATLPDTFADLTALTNLDLSHNALTALPINIFALPHLTYFNLSHNLLTSLPFTETFSGYSEEKSRSSYSGGSFFAPAVARASSPLPRLLTLDVSHNKLTASSIDHTPTGLPASLSKIDLSANPLGKGTDSLLRALGRLENLKQLRFEHADLGGDASFPADLFDGASAPPFPKLSLLDLSETSISADAVQVALKSVKQDISVDVTTSGEPPAGTLSLVVGKKVVKEPWELELERRSARSAPKPAVTAHKTEAKKAAAEPLAKEPWEIEAEQGLLTEGGKRRARAAAAAQAAASSSPSTLGHGQPSASPIPASSSVSDMLANSHYYSASTQTLVLPPSAPLPKNHSRAISLASSSWSTRSTSEKADLMLPTPTLPLSVISVQPFAQTLRTLTLANRRLDISFSLPPASEGELLPRLEELSLEGCGLGDRVAVSRADATVSGASTPPRTTEPLLPLLVQLFPSLRTLDLSFNVLTSAALAPETLSNLILESPGTGEFAQPPRKGLRQLRLRGNRLTELDGLVSVAELFKGNRDVPGWKLEELDLRENEIGKLAPELGLLPLDVFLVDGNIFRVPQRRVWEREGTKGLLSWLRGRIE